DYFQEQHLQIFGPSRAAAQLEGSKVFCKRALRAADIPTADFWVFESAGPALDFVRERFGDTPGDVPLVVKADGLAAGKGAIVCGALDEVEAAIRRVAIEREFGKAGDRFIIEQRLRGPECSILAITDGQTILTLPPAQDHKRAYDGDRGPNTGGMGAYCPAPIVDGEMLAWVEQNVFVPTIHYMKRHRAPFRGILYAGLMLTPVGPRVLEYNVRFGDPECQPLLMRLRTDLVEILELTIAGRLHELEDIEFDPRPAVSVVMAAEGYPNQVRKGDVIRGLSEASSVPDVKIFHGGTRTSDGQIVTAGGRVLSITALGETIPQAKLNAYVAIKSIRWDGAWCRKDIADSAVPVLTGNAANRGDL
ncbi:MAG TPA: phosphoribosylamine--glycine ligase, partial [Pirellulaceae bacterium]|nr:phosphoribosylamine--glycine ligase [Pirellulaceae bacterium]